MPNFIQKGLVNAFLQEVFVYVYYAGHGCADNHQMFVLNEKSIEKIFWPAEKRIKHMLKNVGSNCKAFVVFDCCREHY